MAEEQNELQQGQQSLLRRIVDTTRKPMLVLTMAREVAIANRSFCQTFQITSEAAEGLPLAAIDNGQWDIPELHHLLEEVRTTGKDVESHEIHHDFPVLGPRTLLLNARRLTVPGTSAALLLLAIEDVTEQTETDAQLRTAADALRISEERYRTLFESVDVGFCIIEILLDDTGKPFDYRFLEYNPAFERHTGLTNAIDRTARELVPDLDEFWFRTYGAVALTGESVQFENHAPAMNRWFDVYALRIGAPEKRQVALLFNNITDRKLTEEALRQASAKNERIAETLQRSLLLAPPPDAYPGITVEAIYHSAWDDAQIGGDFFDVFATDGKRVAMVVGDATGKGIEAATYTAEVKFALRAFLRVENGNPAAALTRLSAFIASNEDLDAGHRNREDRSGSFVALSLTVLDTETGEAICACAGSEPPLVLRMESGQISSREITAFGPLLGVTDGAPYEEQRLALELGDLLVMTTDGITEARAPRGVKNRPFFGMNGLAEAAGKVFSQEETSPLSQVGEHVVAQARAWAGGVQHDDICLLLAHRR